MECCTGPTERDRCHVARRSTSRWYASGGQCRRYQRPPMNEPHCDGRCAQAAGSARRRVTRRRTSRETTPCLPRRTLRRANCESFKKAINLKRALVCPYFVHCVTGRTPHRDLWPEESSYSGATAPVHRSVPGALRGTAGQATCRCRLVAPCVSTACCAPNCPPVSPCSKW